MGQGLLEGRGLQGRCWVGGQRVYPDRCVCQARFSMCFTGSDSFHSLHNPWGRDRYLLVPLQQMRKQRCRGGHDRPRSRGQQRWLSLSLQGTFLLLSVVSQLVAFWAVKCEYVFEAQIDAPMYVPTHMSCLVFAWSVFVGGYVDVFSPSLYVFMLLRMSEGMFVCMCHGPCFLAPECYLCLHFSWPVGLHEPVSVCVWM